MAKRFHRRSILRPEKTKEEEEWERKQDEKFETKNIKTPTSVFDNAMIASREAILKDYSQERT